MSRELDVRDFKTSRATPARTEALRAAAADVSETLPGTHRVEVEAIDATTGVFCGEQLRCPAGQPDCCRLVGTLMDCNRWNEVARN